MYLEEKRGTVTTPLLLCGTFEIKMGEFFGRKFKLSLYEFFPHDSLGSDEERDNDGKLLNTRI